MGKKDERWDIYDANRKKTGRTMQRNDWHMAPGDYHISVLGIVTNDEGKFLITKRAMDKEWAPGALEVSGGAVIAGETSDEAIQREVGEETGLDLTGATFTLIDSYRNDSAAEKNNYFVDIYHVRAHFTKADINVQEEEVAGFRLVTYEELLSLVKTTEFLHWARLRDDFAAIAAGRI
jgi:8-oxo-dGTP pyrophosphatase MutT (NUDIX family)